MSLYESYSRFRGQNHITCKAVCYRNELVEPINFLWTVFGATDCILLQRGFGLLTKYLEIRKPSDVQGSMHTPFTVVVDAVAISVDL